MTAAQLIILNGTSSAGKTSTAKEMQKLDESFFHLQMDMFWHMAPAHIEADSKRYPKLKIAMMDSVRALLVHGHNVIFDTVVFAKQVDLVHTNTVHDLEIDTTNLTAEESQRK